MPDAISTLKDYKARIDQAMSDFFDVKIKEAEKIDASSAEVMRNLKEFNLRRGKRIRPALMIHGYKCFKEADQKNERDIIFASLAIELMEGFLLIHDDVLDQDELRRGGPTLHKTYETKYNALKTITPKRFGEGVAIVAGDIQNSLANEIILSSDFPAEIIKEFARKYHEVALKTEYGWLCESMLASKQIEKITESDVMKVNTYKTAAYTVEGPLHMGAILAGADKSQLNALSGFAIPVGIAFQIQDDILGMFGNEKKLGKPIGSDIKEGKVTLLIVKALEKADAKQNKTLLDALGKNDLSMKDIENVRKIITDSGSLDYSKKLAEKRIMQAKQSLENSDFRRQGKDFMIGIADFLIKREY
ncbi:MAG: polyprenyl synthetase family protein [Candidatus Woesearchaeota archaeon]|nr:polyprenyl synthetase family protein [Candidatus Woesearchaeota archaeon]